MTYLTQLSYFLWCDLVSVWAAYRSYEAEFHGDFGNGIVFLKKLVVCDREFFMGMPRTNMVVTLYAGFPARCNANPEGAVPLWFTSCYGTPIKDIPADPHKGTYWEDNVNTWTVSPEDLEKHCAPASLQAFMMLIRYAEDARDRIAAQAQPPQAFWYKQRFAAL